MVMENMSDSRDHVKSHKRDKNRTRKPDKITKGPIRNGEMCEKCHKEGRASNCSCIIDRNDLNATKMKRALQKELSLVERIRLIKEHEENKKSLRVLAEQFRVGRSTVARILKKRESIRKEHEADKKNRDRCRKKRRTESEFVNEVVWKWFQNVKMKKITVSGPIIQSKARSFALDLGFENFKASNGWLATFKKAHGIQLPFLKACGAVREKQIGKKDTQLFSKLDEAELRVDSNEIVSNKRLRDERQSETKRCEDRNSVLSNRESTEVPSSFYQVQRDEISELTVQQNSMSRYVTEAISAEQWNHEASSFQPEVAEEQVNVLHGSEMTQQQMMNLITTAYDYAVTKDQTLLNHVLNLKCALEASIVRDRFAARRQTPNGAYLW